MTWASSAMAPWPNAHAPEVRAIWHAAREEGSPAFETLARLGERRRSTHVSDSVGGASTVPEHRSLCWRDRDVLPKSGELVLLGQVFTASAYQSTRRCQALAREMALWGVPPGGFDIAWIEDRIQASRSSR